MQLRHTDLPSLCTSCCQLTKFHQEQKAKLDAHIKPGGQRNALQVSMSRALLLHAQTLRHFSEATACIYQLLVKATVFWPVGIARLTSSGMQPAALTTQVLCNSLPGGAAALVACASSMAAQSSSTEGQLLPVVQLAAWCAFLVSAAHKWRQPTSSPAHAVYLINSAAWPYINNSCSSGTQYNSSRC